MPDLQKHGVAVHAITADVGDVAAKLAAEGVTVSFPIYSDPEGALVVPDACIFGPVDQSRAYYIQVQKHEYMPALFVTDERGCVTTWWSWKKLSAEVLDKVAAMDLDPDVEGEYDPGLVNVDPRSFGTPRQPDGSPKEAQKKTWLVNMRPRSADLISAILEGRPMELEEVLTTEETMAAHQRSISIAGVKPPYPVPP